MSFAIFEFAFVRGLAAGFALAAPVGPVALLCIRRALTQGRLHGFIAALGAALADMMFGAIAGLGLTAISSFIIDHEMAIGLLGGMIVLAVGIITFRAPIYMADGNPVMCSLRRDFTTTFGMAVTNPATMIAAIGVFAAFGPVHVNDGPDTAFLLVAGVFGGSAIWWLLLAGAAGTWRRRAVEKSLAQLNRVSGALMALSGVAVLAFVMSRAFNAS